MTWKWSVAVMLVASAGAQVETPVSFRVTYVASGAVYLQGGRDAGLAPGYKLAVKRIPPGEPSLQAPVLAEITVVSVASSSAVCEFQSGAGAVAVGDIAFLTAADAEVFRLLRTAKNARRHIQVISFSEGDPLEEEARESVPRPPLPEVNRIKARATFEFNGIDNRSTFSGGSRQAGVSFRADMTRIAGSFWNFNGYWRWRMNRSGGGGETLTDLVNRTYHIGVQYNNPLSRHILGFGRLLLPWAASLDTLDGGYWALRVRRNVTAGIFGGTTPDPTSWNYAAGRQMAGNFISLDLGEFDRIKYVGTAGLAITRRNWAAEREFLFIENTLLLGRRMSLFQILQADKLSGRFGSSDRGIAITRSYLSFRIQPRSWVSLDVSHNQMRGIPTFDSRLIGTGLLDRYLFTGLSGGVRFELPRKLSLYGGIGENQRDGEARGSLNHMYGAVIGNFFDSGLRLEFRRSAFDSTFGRGSYYLVSGARELHHRLRIEVQGGKQNFQSSLSNQNRALFISTNLDWFFGERYSLGAGYVIYRGSTQSYDQYFTNIGYRF